jgi:hypothetical protein
MIIYKDMDFEKIGKRSIKITEDYSHEQALLDFCTENDIFFKDPALLKVAFHDTHVDGMEKKGDSLLYIINSILDFKYGIGFDTSNSNFGHVALEMGMNLVITRKEDAKNVNSQGVPHPEIAQTLANVFERFCYALYLDQGVDAVVLFAEKHLIAEELKRFHEKRIPKERLSWNSIQDDNAVRQKRNDTLTELAKDWVPDFEISNRRPVNTKDTSGIYRPRNERVSNSAVFYPALLKPQAVPSVVAVEASRLLVSQANQLPHEQPSREDIQNLLRELPDPKGWEIIAGDHSLVIDARDHGSSLHYISNGPFRGVMINGKCVALSYRGFGSKVTNAYKNMVRDVSAALKEVDYVTDGFDGMAWPPLLDQVFCMGTYPAINLK